MTIVVAARGRAGSPAAPPAGTRGSLRLLAHQVWYEQLSFWQNPQSAVFTFYLPGRVHGYHGRALRRDRDPRPG